MRKRLQRMFDIGAILVIVTMLVLVMTVPVWAANDDGNGAGEGLALMIAGFIAPYLTQVLKRLFGDLESMPALWLSFVVAVVISLVALVITGELGWTTPPSEPVAFVTWFLQFVGGVFGIATLVYKVLIKRPEKM